MLDLLRSQLTFWFEQGGAVMVPLVALAAVLWYALGYRMLSLRRGDPRPVNDLIKAYRKQGLPETTRGILDAAAARGMRLLVRTAEPRPVLDEAFYDYEEELRRHATLADSIVKIAPLLGLLGTVSGMIETFDSLGDMSFYSQSGGIAGGISEALFSTQMGLVVAIPGLLVGRVLLRKQKVLESELTIIKDLLCGEANTA